MATRLFSVFFTLKKLGKICPILTNIFQMGWFNHQFFNIGHVTYTAQQAGFPFGGLKRRLGVVLKAFLCTVFARIQMFVVPKFVFFPFLDRSDNLIQPKMMLCKNFLTEIPHPTFKTFLFVFCKQVMEKRNIPSPQEWAVSSSAPFLREDAKLHLELKPCRNSDAEREFHPPGPCGVHQRVWCIHTVGRLCH